MIRYGLTLVAIFFTWGAWADSVTETFAKADRNGDGRLTIKEAPIRAKMIRAADEDNSGDVTIEEVRKYLAKRIAATQPDADAPPKTIAAEEFPDGAPITRASCEKAAAYSDSANGHAVVVMYQGKILFEHYANGWSAEKAHRLASGTKSFSGAMLAAAVKDGLIKLDEPVSQTITEWKSDGKLAKITIKDLLSLTSGIHPGLVGKVPTYKEAIVVKTPKTEPGEKFAYGPVPYQVFGEVMRRKLDGEDPLNYLKKRILDPIGMKIGDWRQGDDGNALLPSGAFLQATEWIKFGELLRTDGGKTLDTKTGRECITGSKANPRYGITFWLLDEGFMAAGAGKQKLYVLPEKEMVIVRFGETKGQGFKDEAFLNRLVPDRK